MPANQRVHYKPATQFLPLCDEGYAHPARQVDGELRAGEDVHGLRPVGHRLVRRRSNDEGALPGLRDAEVAGIEHAKAHLHSIQRWLRISWHYSTLLMSHMVGIAAAAT
jgi:hypothetical protein